VSRPSIVTNNPRKEAALVKIRIGSVREQLGKGILGLAGGLLLGGAVLATTGCGSSSSTSTSPDPGGSNSNSNVTASFTANPGTHLAHTVTGPGQISLTVKGIDDGESDKRTIVFFYDAKGYSQGRGGLGFEGEVRNHKMKWYDSNGHNIAEDYHGVVFNPADTHTITLSWTAGGMSLSIDGAVRGTWSGSTTFPFTLGIGSAPNGPGGFAGAVYTNVTWPAGSTEAP
jgi:hypothetical protein